MRTPPLVGEDSLHAVSALAADDIWAVGRVGSSTLTEHWDGSAWSVVASPDPLATSSGTNFLTGVAAVSPTEVWAVGGARDFTAGGLVRTATLRYDGTGWRVVHSPNAGSGDNTLLGVASPGPGHLLAVGSYRPTISAYDRTLVLTADRS